MPSKRGRARKTARRARTESEARERSLEALQQMRSEGLSLTRAARQSHTTPATVRKYVGSAVRQTRGGRYVATPSDRLTRRVWFLTKAGKVEVAVRGSRPASRVARYMAAVDRYLRTGETSDLDRGGQYVNLELRILDRLRLLQPARDAPITIHEYLQTKPETNAT